MSDTQTRPTCIQSTRDVQAHVHVYPQSTEPMGPVRRLGKAAGLERIGINIQRLAPGQRSSWPHAEENEEEFVYVLSGEVEAWIDGHLHSMRPGDLAAFPAGTGIAHCFINNSLRDALLLVGGEAPKPGSRIIYPLSPSRRQDMPAQYWWGDAPVRALGPHDGLPDAWRASLSAGRAEGTSAWIASPENTAIRESVATSIRLRRARADDALCLSVLAMQVFLDTYATEGIRPVVAREVVASFSEHKFAEALAHAHVHIEVAERDGHLVGFAQTTLGESHELAPAGRQAELFRLYVQEPFTDAKIGSQLLAAAERAAAATGAQVLWLTPWVHNHRARAFYARRGFQDCGLTYFEMEGELHENRVLAKRIEAR